MSNEIEIGDLVNRHHDDYVDGPYIYYGNCEESKNYPHILYNKKVDNIG
jgi:hypothetical protein